MNSPARLRLESLEDRWTPATLSDDGRSVTFKDIDGDSAIIAFRTAVLTPDNVNSVFQFAAGTVDGSNSLPQQLQTLDLSVLPPGLVVTAQSTRVGNGDGRLDIGWIKADGKDEDTITLMGDAGRVTAGDANTRTAGIKYLTVGTLGARGLVTQGGTGSLTTVVNGPLGSLAVVSRDVVGANVRVVGGVDGRLDLLFINGSLLADPVLPNTGLIETEGAIGEVQIGDDIVGGAGDNSGLRSGGAMGNIVVLNNVTGGGGADSGSIISAKGIKLVAIGESLTGGLGERSGSIRAINGDIGEVAIAGRFLNTFLAGGAGPGSGTVSAFTEGPRGGRIRQLSIGGDLVGGTGPGSGAVYAEGGLGPVTVQNIVGDAIGSGSIATGRGKIGAMTVTGNIQGGDGDGSASIFGAGGIRSVTITGNVLGGAGKGSASLAAAGGRMGNVKIGGNLTGGTGVDSASIQSLQIPVGTTSRFIGGQMGSVTISGEVRGGSGSGSASILSDQSMGAIAVGTNWTAASIAAGVKRGADGQFGTNDDTGRAARISSITIGGAVEGTSGGTDHFAFTAAQVVKLSEKGAKVALKPGRGNDTIALGSTLDFELKERVFVV